MMRKIFALAVAVLLCVLAASLASADTVNLGFLGASVEFPLTYTLLTPGNLEQQATWLDNHDLSPASVASDFAARGVLVQAWGPEGDVCVEITAVQDDDSRAWGDIDEATKADRSHYRSRHLKDGYKDEGYTFQTAEWKNNPDLGGRWLMLRYKRTTGDTTYRGYMRRTIKRGATITIDLQVYNRALRNSDDSDINTIWNTWTFSEESTAFTPAAPAEGVATPTDAAETAESTEGAEAAAPAVTVTASSASKAPTNLKLETVPPEETNTGEFTVKGTCNPGLKLIGVLMRMSGSEPTRVETVAGRNGKFTLNVKLPQEGIWLMTLNIEDENGNIVDERVFTTTTYSANLLVVNFDNPLPDENHPITGDTYTISGKTLKNTTVQCIVDGKFNKQIKTNGTGVFRFKIDTAATGAYNFTLVMSKKNYSTRRYTSRYERTYTPEELFAKAVSSAIKPSYAQLTKKIDGYVGRIMVYNLYITDAQKAGDEWIVFGAMKRSGGTFKEQVAITCPENPGFETGTQHRMYGTCLGTYQVQDSVNGDQYLPCFELIAWNDK